VLNGLEKANDEFIKLWWEKTNISCDVSAQGFPVQTGLAISMQCREGTAVVGC